MRKVDAIDVFLKQDTPPGAIVVKANHDTNPFLPAVLLEEMELDRQRYPDRFDHIWLGDYARAFEGSYYCAALGEARAQGRIGVVSADPLLPIRAYWDLGGSGASADALSIWIVQFVGMQIRVLDFIEGQGQVLGYYVGELRSRGYDKVLCVLPHNGMASNSVTGKRYRDHLEDAGFETQIVKNQGAGAAMQRVEAVRRIFPQCWFNETTCEAGLDALGYYHERRDEARNAGLGPSHDWSSHAADAFGLLAVAYEEPIAKSTGPKYRPRSRRAGHDAWLAG